MTKFACNSLSSILTTQPLYAASVSKELPTVVAIDNPTSMFGGATSNLGAKCSATNQCVDPESNRHLADVFEIELIPSTTSSDACSSLCVSANSYVCVLSLLLVVLPALLILPLRTAPHWDFVAAAIVSLVNS